MQTGKQIRLNRFFTNKRSLVIPFDHGLYSGVVRGIEDPHTLVEKISRTAADGILVTPGVLKIIAPAVGELAVMLRLDGGLTAYTQNAADYRPICTVEHALSLGADAVIVMTFAGTPYEGVSLEKLGRVAEDADNLGVPLVSEILPPSLLNNHFNREMQASTGKDGVIKEIADMIRIGTEHGADLIKTRYAGEPDDFRDLLQHSIIPVLIAGGPKGDGSVEQMLRSAFEAIHAGAHGIIYGRNVWQHPDLEKMIGALSAIVHEDASVGEALQILK